MWEIAVDKFVLLSQYLSRICSIQCLAYGLDDSEFESRQGQQIFIFSKTSILAVRLTQPVIRWVPSSCLYVGKAAET